ncbi:LCP family protein [Parageobacillus thermoglucosidasius]|uniref:Regulatory protein MsrR n=2 Tax=Parageobacillus thermoglucosidasius TaxID=1426 RepID=A0AAN1D790_PARTM|nr:LCP family protein [Parageobacillus thermoglucosidasius]ALF10899.1 transcriptional regulator [Parageobacillus thermoglucosidasius]ANZ30974.1 transcriptional regulator [Parageobacillus thermoglucosidasius]APM81711.1 transcriptional regulator [Parageobacillus thermoglucosidasius]KJX69166.1 transcriptional regulator [Parageobacillus thermoglucosidasius]RDE25446.1 LytR family transcriptional regulator [Parageobacillus thermoglucosidasius]
MENKRNASRLKRRKKKKKLLMLFFLIIVLLFLGILLYIFVEYQQSLKNSQNGSSLQHENIKFNGVRNKSGKINILLLGIDARGKEKSRADTIMIAQYDPEAKKFKIASIMRDSYVYIPGHGKNKINAAHAYGGPELLRKTIKNNFDIDIEYFILVDFKGFTKAIDKAFPEGIEINVEKEMSKGIGVTLHPGVQKLHGKELLGYVRFRKDAESDFGRVRRQQEVLKQIIDEFISIKGIVKLPSVIGTIQPYILTNIEYKQALSILTSFLSSDTKNIDFFRIPVDESFEDVTYPQVGAVLDIDIEQNKKALKEFLYK